MVPVYFPKSQSEVSVISALFEAYEIPFFVRGDGFSRLYPGVPIKDFNIPAFMVPPGFHEPAKELLAAFIEPGPRHPPVPTRTWVRLLSEAWVFGWFIAGHRWTEVDDEPGSAEDFVGAEQQ